VLVLSRYVDESIMIGDEVEITVVDTRDGKVRLGITAPTNIPVHRREIYDAIKRIKREEKQKAEQTKNEKPPEASQA
jgi:carbon storage regulator